jgi:hypothetical protein
LIDEFYSNKPPRPKGCGKISKDANGSLVLIFLFKKQKKIAKKQQINMIDKFLLTLG